MKAFATERKAKYRRVSQEDLEIKEGKRNGIVEGRVMEHKALSGTWNGRRSEKHPLKTSWKEHMYRLKQIQMGRLITSWNLSDSQTFSLTETQVPHYK